MNHTTHHTDLSATKAFDLIVVGDEVESILSAVSAARMGLSVALVRYPDASQWLGGLSTRGGLSYMDITLPFKSPLFREFLDLAGVIRVALRPEKAHAVLEGLIRQNKITVFSGWLPAQVTLSPVGRSIQAAGFYSSNIHNAENRPVEKTPETLYLKASYWLDATPDALLARLAGVPAIEGLGGLLGEDANFLGISPVFEIQGVTKHPLIGFEASLRAKPEMPEWLKTALPHHSQAHRDALITRPCFSPDEEDYLDILNPVIGLDYHVWRHGAIDSYGKTPCWIDGGNVSLLGEKRMGFNGLVSHGNLHQADDPLEQLLAYSLGLSKTALPADLRDEMQAFQTYLKEAGQMPDVHIQPPQALYVRQTYTLLSKENMTARWVLQGGAPDENCLGSYSYWLDFRGVILEQHFPGETLPKPVFNVNLDGCFPQTPKLDNLAFMGRSAGYSPMGQGVGRIVQYNAFLGEALGIAAGLAKEYYKPMGDVPLPRIKRILDERNGMPLPVVGEQTASDDFLLASQALQKDDAILLGFRTKQVGESVP
jgi:hypothetical protein